MTVLLHSRIKIANGVGYSVLSFLPMSFKFLVNNANGIMTDNLSWKQRSAKLFSDMRQVTSPTLNLRYSVIHAEVLTASMRHMHKGNKNSHAAKDLLHLWQWALWPSTQVKCNHTSEWFSLPLSLRLRSEIRESNHHPSHKGSKRDTDSYWTGIIFNLFGLTVRFGEIKCYSIHVNIV